MRATPFPLDLRLPGMKARTSAPAAISSAAPLLRAFKLSTVIPVYNEESTVGEEIERVLAVELERFTRK
jgi:hypothetical protein